MPNPSEKYKELENIERKIHELKVEKQQLPKKREKLEREQIKAQEEAKRIEQNQQLFHNYRNELRKLEKEAEELKANINQKESEKEKFTAQLQKLRDDYHENIKNIKGLENNLQELNYNINTKLDIIQKLSLKVEEKNSNIAKINQETKELEEEEPQNAEEKTSTGSEVGSEENNTKKQLNELASRKHIEERDKNNMEDNLWHIEQQKYEYITRAESVKDKLNTLKKANTGICKNIDEIKANLSKLGAEIKADYPESYDIPNDSISRLKQEEQRIMNKRRKEIEKEQAKKNESKSVAEGNSDKESSSQQLTKDNNSKESSPEELALERNEQKQQELKNKMAEVSGLSNKHSESDEAINLLHEKVENRKKNFEAYHQAKWSEIRQETIDCEIQMLNNKFDNTLGEYAKAVTDDAPEF
jgi:chromosome segregation ATPase